MGKVGACEGTSPIGGVERNTTKWTFCATPTTSAGGVILMVLLDASYAARPLLCICALVANNPTIASEQCGYLLAVCSSVYALRAVERVSARAPHGAPQRAPTG